jgi:hypothetical protein
VTIASPRLDPRLRRAAPRLDDPRESIAETWRKVGRKADELALPRPGYDTVRLIVRDHRRRRAAVRELLEPVLADVLQGRISAWDVARVIEAVQLERAGE